MGARRKIVTNLLATERHSLDTGDEDRVANLTQGYSGADMSNLCKEAAMGPIRSLDFSQIQNMTSDQVRPICYEDFTAALRQVKATVSAKDLDMYLEWNELYGAGK